MQLFYYLKKIWLAIAYYKDYWKIIWDRHVETYSKELTRENNFLFPLSNLERQRYVVDTMRFNNKDVFLDIGCGAGHVLKAVSDTVKEGWGIDISPRMVAFTQKSLQDLKNIQIKVGNITDLPFENNTFTKILCYGVIHYVPGREFGRAINELHRVTAPGGRILIGDIPKKNYRWKHKGFRVNRFYLDKTVNMLGSSGQFEIKVLKDSPSIFDLLLIKKSDG